jgi:hypothetical protein
MLAIARNAIERDDLEKLVQSCAAVADMARDSERTNGTPPWSAFVYSLVSQIAPVGCTHPECSASTAEHLLHMGEVADMVVKREKERLQTSLDKLSQMHAPASTL